MMTEEKRIEWLLELQEHPEQLTVTSSCSRYSLTTRCANL